MGGWHLNALANVARDQPVGTAAERADAIARWSALPAYIDQEIANARLCLARGSSAHQPGVLRVISQMDGIVSAQPEALPFFAPATRAEDPAFRRSFRSVLAGPVNAAFRRYGDCLRDEYLPGAREALGVSANPNGVQCYGASLRSYTTLNRPPEEVFRLGQQTVAANAARVRELDRKSTRLNSSHLVISYAVFCLKKNINQRVTVAALCVFFVVAAIYSGCDGRDALLAVPIPPRSLGTLAAAGLQIGAVRTSGRKA